LWFENQPQDVRTQVEEIEDCVKDAGFIPRIQMEVDTTNLDALGKQQQVFDEFDLVVVDFDLGKDNMSGDDVALTVRRSFGFTDIIFYSGQKTVDLRKLVNERQIDGVYCIERQRLAERLAVHIEQSVKRMSRLEAMRGLTMGTVGKCDDEIREFLRAKFKSCIEGKQAEMSALVDELVNDAARLQTERYQKCETFEEKLASRAVTSFHLQKLALAVLKGDEGGAELRKVLTRYDAEVLKPRNTLGHAVEIRGERGWEVSSHGEDPISSKDFPKLRLDMGTHVENIFRLRPLLEREGTNA